MAGLLKYWQHKSLPTDKDTGLGSVLTKEANSAVKKILDREDGAEGRKRKYTHFTPDQRAKIGRHAAEFGNASTVKRFKDEFPTLGESTVRQFKERYKAELKKSPEQVTQLPSKKLGRPLTLGMLDSKVQQYIRSLRAAGTPINARIAIAAAEGIVKATDRTMLYENGGHILLSGSWAYSLLKRMGYVQRKASTKSKVSLSKMEFEVVKKAYLNKIKAAVVDGKIPPELIINFDQSGVNIVPSSQWTQAEKGSTRVEVSGYDDKRQITITVAGTLSGEFLPFQILYTGKTERCHPLSPFPNGFDVWHTPNHWANSETCVRYLEKIILPYVIEKRRQLGLSEEHMALVIFDVFKGHQGDDFKAILSNNNILSVLVPSNCTDLLQPMDVSVQKPLKDQVRNGFQSWYSEQVTDQLNDGKQAEEIIVSTQLSRMKPIGVRWITAAYDYLRSKPEIIRAGFAKTGITQILEPSGVPEELEIENPDPFDDDSDDDFDDDDGTDTVTIDSD